MTAKTVSAAIIAHFATLKLTEKLTSAELDTTAGIRLLGNEGVVRVEVDGVEKFIGRVHTLSGGHFVNLSKLQPGIESYLNVGKTKAVGGDIVLFSIPEGVVEVSGRLTKGKAKSASSGCSPKQKQQLNSY